MSVLAAEILAGIIAGNLVAAAVGRLNLGLALNSAWGALAGLLSGRAMEFWGISRLALEHIGAGQALAHAAGSFIAGCMAVIVVGIAMNLWYRY